MDALHQRVASARRVEWLLRFYGAIRWQAGQARNTTHKKRHTAASVLPTHWSS
ncbi:hypothetical protein ACCD10_10925 [Pseudomonas sp. Pseusp122]|uniref:hypothetical protein n=1 Tax=unclassified Pseudomonas TaxID=196821 RepID=UPI0039A6FAA7